MTKILVDALSAHPRAALCWRAVLGLLLAVVTWLALTPAPPSQAGLLWDKLNHCAAFASLAVAGTLGFQRRWWAVALGLLAYGGPIEVLQAFTPTRVGEWADLLADGIGIALGLGLAAALAGWAAARPVTSPAPD
ncbi:MAG: VanZ family protein [Aquabacterium sp.]|nr:VanZ family protein [Aquabacterium sp.]